MKIKEKNKSFEIKKNGITIELTFVELKSLFNAYIQATSYTDDAIEKELKRRGLTVSEEDFKNLVKRYDEVADHNLEIIHMSLKSCLKEAFKSCGF